MMACFRSIASRASHFRRRYNVSVYYPIHCDDYKEDTSQKTTNRYSSRSYFDLTYKSHGGLGLIFRDRRHLPSSFVSELGVVSWRDLSTAADGGSSGIEYMHDIAWSLPETTADMAAAQAPVIEEVVLAAGDSFLPIASLQYVIGHIHSFTGLNWWELIALAILLIRGATIPLAINQLKATSKLTRKVCKSGLGDFSDILFCNRNPFHPVNFCGRATFCSSFSKWSLSNSCVSNNTDNASEVAMLQPTLSDDKVVSLVESEGESNVMGVINTRNTVGSKKKGGHEKTVDFSEVDATLLPTVILVGRPNVGKSALFNRLIRRREALVYNTPDDHVTRDIREGIAKLGDLRFRVLDSAGLEMAASSGSILDRTSKMTANVIARSQFAVFMVDVREGLHPMDFDVGKWLRKHAPKINIVLVMNKCESVIDDSSFLAAAAGEVYNLGFGDPVAISAETGLGMSDLYEVLAPMLENYMLQVQYDSCDQESCDTNSEELKLPLQLAIVGKPNVGKSTLLNALLQEDRVLVGPEAGLTRDSIRVEFQFQGRVIYLVDTAGWLQRAGQDKGPSSLSIVQSRKNLMRAHVVALVLDAEEIAKSKSSMKHAEVVIARRAVEEGRGLVVIVNKMDLLRDKRKGGSYEQVKKAVPEEIRTSIPQVTSIPVVFVSALEGRGRTTVMKQVVDTYEKWCLRLPTARLNRWMRKVMSRHSWKDQAAQPKIKYFTQVKARPPTFVAFVRGKTLLSDTEIRFLTKSLEEDFDIGGIPIRILQRPVVRYSKVSGRSSSAKRTQSASHKMVQRVFSDKRTVEA